MILTYSYCPESAYHVNFTDQTLVSILYKLLTHFVIIHDAIDLTSPLELLPAVKIINTTLP